MKYNTIHPNRTIYQCERCGKQIIVADTVKPDSLAEKTLRACKHEAGEATLILISK